MAESLIKGVSDTAFMVAAWRAIESERPDALFRDPFAARLAGEHGKAIVASLNRSFLRGWQVVIRTVIIDELIRRAVAAGTDTIVNLGAGLDARPYRMELPEALRWIEVDYPQVIDWKADQLAGERPRCRLEPLKLDLADLVRRQALFASLGASSKKILFLTEGVIPYLTTDAVGTLADHLKAIPGGNAGVDVAWIVDYFSPEAMRYRQRISASRQMREVPFQFEPGDWFAFFARHGWKPAEVQYIADEAARQRRPIPLPPLLKLLVKLRHLFSSPARRAQFRTFAGYVLLKPTGAT
jgi:methyltransferase (TIGR00027 family)